MKKQMMRTKDKSKDLIELNKKFIRSSEPEVDLEVDSK